MTPDPTGSNPVLRTNFPLQRLVKADQWLPALVAKDATDTIDTRITALRATVIRRAGWRGLPWRLWRTVRAAWTA